MKVSSVIVLFLVVKTNASFLDDFKGAMSSVECSFGKLITDVVSDVKTTVQCTILAMEQVLALNGIVAKPLPNKLCNNDKFDRNRNFSSENNLVHEIHSSISNVNKTLSHILDDNGHERLKDVRRVVQNESKRLTEVSVLLRKELEKISQRLKKEFQNVDFNSDISTLENVRNNMKILYEVEKKDKSVSEEIGKVLSEAMDVLHINMNNEVKSDEEKIKVIMNMLKQDANDKGVQTIDQELSQSKREQSALHNNLEHNPGQITKGFKDIVAKDLRHNDNVRKEVNEYISHKSSTVANSKLSSDILTENDASKISKTSGDDLSLFGKTNTEDSKAIEEAMDIIKDAAPTQALLDDFFSKNLGSDVFDKTDSPIF